MRGGAAVAPSEVTAASEVMKAATAIRRKIFMNPPMQTFQYSSPLHVTSRRRAPVSSTSEFAARKIHPLRRAGRMWQEHPTGAARWQTSRHGNAGWGNPRTGRNGYGRKDSPAVAGYEALEPRFNRR